MSRKSQYFGPIVTIPWYFNENRSISDGSSCLSSVIKITKKIDNFGLLQEKTKQRGWGYTFLKTPLECLDLSFYPKKFQRKQAFTPGNSAKLYDTPWKCQGQKPRAMEITRSFPAHPLKCHFFFNWPLEFPHVFSLISLEIPCPQPLPLFGFFLKYSPFWGVLAKNLPKSSLKWQPLLVQKHQKI